VEVQAQGASFVGARLTYCDFSYADVRGADFSNADLSSATLHGVLDKDAVYSSAVTAGMKRDDLDRLEAEAWRPPGRGGARGG
jgi:uncharacterized protein YjbI with pentapeptide repeats